MGLEVYAVTTKYMVMSRDQNAGRSHSVKTDSSSFERVEEFKYLGTTRTNQNFIQEEIKSRLKSGMLAVIRCRSFVFQCAIQKFKIKIYRTIILLVVLCGCETWSLTFREEHRPRVFENRVLRRILGPKMDEVTGEWRKLHSEKLNDFSSPNNILVMKLRRMRWVIRVARMGRGFSGLRKCRGKKPLGRPRCRSEVNIEVDIQEVGCEGMDWIELAQDRDRWRALVTAAMKLWVP